MPSAYGRFDRAADRAARYWPQRRIDVAPTQAIVSFSFDDVPVSAFENGARLLEARGFFGTFFVAGGLAGQRFDGHEMLDVEGYRQLAARGHEIGHHTFSHQVPTRLGRGYQADLVRNDDYLSAIIARPARNFAFPYGLASPLVRGELARRFRSSRSIMPGINRGPTDPDYLKAVEIKRESRLEMLQAWIDEAVAHRGWLVFFTHDVQDEPGIYGCRTGWLESLIERAVDKGAEVLTVDAALDRMGIAG
jgi:peptidoglycan/xylan/chitin deacetylase (PgdA/CDA1 family)